jgi:hypothetical protein
MKQLSFITIIKLLVALVFVLLLVYVIVIFIRKRNNFVDIPSTTFDMSKVKTTPSDSPSGCSNGTDIPSVCMNFNSCCSSSYSNVNGQCFCNHPFVKDCNDKYKTCISNNTNTNTSNCSDILQNCCKQYSRSDILASNFQNPINATQNSNKLCSINGIVNLEQRCMEICQTNPNCRAYSTAIGNCTLYDKTNYIQSSDPNSIYVIKK